MLPTRLYFSNAVGSVLFVPESFVYLHFTGEPMSSPELRALYVHAANLLARYRLSGILADHRAMPAAFETPDREWLLTEWLPHTVPPPPPVVRYAVLPSPSATRRLHTEAVLQELAQYLIVQVFEDLDSAANWLKAGNDPTQAAAAAAATATP
ncbi:hypothetical protein Q3A66_09635 [Hymenobacter sp. BT770]|uniref:hypothetical protein n=1 Tax=Hymenobacter sp. BT770 TaxID=2886942 RepID=UPI001D1213F4|nr:hypothetical protein [Hymenobacter sp. BT770]MCC3153197.1 hypothetical protein [Hymenobacter sp. BT770]MDO3415329.1 hypothetical protein [Hymenobacter sp. BT770]